MIEIGWSVSRRPEPNPASDATSEGHARHSLPHRRTVVEENLPDGPHKHRVDQRLHVAAVGTGIKMTDLQSKRAAFIQKTRLTTGQPLGDVVIRRRFMKKCLTRAGESTHQKIVAGECKMTTARIAAGIGVICGNAADTVIVKDALAIEIQLYMPTVENGTANITPPPGNGIPSISSGAPAEELTASPPRHR